MLIITNHQRNATQNHMSHHLTPVKMDINQKTRNNVLARMWKREPLCSAVGNGSLATLMGSSIKI